MHATDHTTPYDPSAETRDVQWTLDRYNRGKRPATVRGAIHAALAVAAVARHEALAAARGATWPGPRAFTVYQRAVFAAHNIRVASQA